MTNATIVRRSDFNLGSIGNIWTPGGPPSAPSIGDRLLLLNVSRGTTTQDRMHTARGWSYVGGGVGGTGAIANDAGIMAADVYGIEITSGNVAAFAAGGTAGMPDINGDQISAYQVYKITPDSGYVFADSLASSGWIASASDTGTGSPFGGTTGTFADAPTAGDALIVHGGRPTDAGGAAPATTSVTCAGLSGGSKDNHYRETGSGNDMSLAGTVWTDFTGTATDGVAASWTFTSSNHSGVILALAIRLEPDLDPPGVPTNVAETHTHNTITPTWDPPASGGAVDYYELRVDGGSESTWTSGTPITGLSPETEYDVEVRAVNGAGESDWVLITVTTNAEPEEPTTPATNYPLGKIDRPPDRAIQPKVGGVWLRSLGAFGPVTMEYGSHGFDAASWQMQPGFTHPLLRGGTYAEVYLGGERVGGGHMAEPGTDGQFHVLGLWRDAERMPAMTSGTAATSVLDDAIDYAYSVGGIRFPRRVSVSSTAHSEDANATFTVGSLLTSLAESVEREWFVDPRSGFVELQVLEGLTPKWRVPHSVAGRGLTPAEDDFYTHLVGRYWNGTAYAFVTVSDPDAADIFRPRFKTVDLSKGPDSDQVGLGPIDSTRATAELNARLAKSGARMGWADGLQLGYGQITNMGGVPAAFSQIRNGDCVRLEGVVDTSRANRVRGYIDIIVAECSYTDGGATITIKPRGKAPRNFEEVLAFRAVPDMRHT